MAYTFGVFVDMIDEELKQKEYGHITSISNNLKNAKYEQIIDWTNQGLARLSSANPEFWTRLVTATPTTGVDLSDDGWDVPDEWRRLQTVIIDEAKYKVGIYVDSDADIYKVRNNIIQKRDTGFESGKEVKLWGIFKPTKILRIQEAIDYLDVTDPGGAPHTEAEAKIYIDSLEVDIDETYIRPLILSVLLKYAARENMKTEIWFAAYQDELAQFRRAEPPVNTIGIYKNEIPFGDF